MELGRKVILLNTYNLYESLYDALNQYYEEFGNQKLVNLGLGTHRLKCAVHEQFRLYIIADKASVYDAKRFPIPLLNRLEKHFLNSTTLLDATQRLLVEELNTWAFSLAQRRTGDLSDSFVGFNADTCASLILHLGDLNRAKDYLIKTATPDFIIRTGDANLHREYFQNQGHLALDELLDYHLNRQTDDANRLLQISTHSKSSLFGLDLDKLKTRLTLDSVELCLLNAFDTQHQFIDRIGSFLNRSCEKTKLLLVQMELNQKYDYDLLACVRHLIVETVKEHARSAERNNEYLRFFTIYFIY